MQRKFAIIIDNGMPRVGASLKTYDDVCLLRKHIRDLSFALVTPICSNYRFYHKQYLPFLTIFACRSQHPHSAVLHHAIHSAHTCAPRYVRTLPKTVPT